MSEKEKQVQEIKQQIEILKQEIQNKQALLNGLLNILNKEEQEIE